jgi:hypothetical protein
VPPTPTSDRLPLDTARSNLAKLWFAGSAVVFVLLVLQSFGTAYHGRLAEVWGWAFPTVLPTLSLILSVLGAAAIGPETPSNGPKNEIVVRRDFYRITFWLSTVYLVLILGTVLAEPVLVYVHSPTVSADQVMKADSAGGGTAATQVPAAADVLKLSNLWLGPFQGLVVAAIGTLFFTKKAGDGKSHE